MNMLMTKMTVSTMTLAHGVEAVVKVITMGHHVAIVTEQV
jgi:hypothetical protein